MSKKPTKEKARTLRQQMRVVAELKLAGLMDKMNEAAAKVINDTTIDPVDLMAMCCKSQVGTLKAKLVGRLANEAERELVEMWNKQQKLELGDEND